MPRFRVPRPAVQVQEGLLGSRTQASLITFVWGEKFSHSRFVTSCDTMSGTQVTQMRLPFLKFSSSQPGKLSRKDAKVFAEACELALLRLEQCIADAYISRPVMDDRRIGGWSSTPKKMQEPVLSPMLMELGRVALHEKDSAAI